MEVIRKLGDRVEKEHDQYLRDSQRIEDRSAVGGVNGMNGVTSSGTVDFESLVAGGNATVKADNTANSNVGWDDDPWGSIFGNGDPQVKRFSVHHCFSFDRFYPVADNRKSCCICHFSPAATSTAYTKLQFASSAAGHNSGVKLNSTTSWAGSHTSYFQ